MENENIQKLIEAISNSPELQQKLQAEAEKPVTRGPKDKGLGTALLNTIAQSAGVNFSSGDMSQLTGMLGQIGNIAGNSSAPSLGGLQLLNPGSSGSSQSSAASSMGVDDLLSMFSGGSTQAANNNLLNLLGNSGQAQATQANANSLGNFLSMFAGGNQTAQVSQSSSGLSGAAILKLLLKLLY